MLSFSVDAQLEASIWYFGDYAGLDFRSGTPVPLTDGALRTNEGCSTISDAAGNLKFYTDGSTVWNRDHEIMPNGEFLLGSSTSTQSGLIVPHPGNQDLYYVFTVAAALNGGLNYSVVDMSLDGGLGAVTTKNVNLVGLTPEKVTAVLHANGRDIWVVTHEWGNDAFLSFLVTPAGLNTNPVVSNVGLVLDFPGTIGQYRNKSHGYLKASPNGKKMAICHLDENVELLDFDNATGRLSNAVSLFSRSRLYYGAEFSPNGKLLYITVGGIIYQFQTDVLDVPASIILIDNSWTSSSGMQLAIDGKIYVTTFGERNLSVINNPNQLGTACNFEAEVIDLLGRRSWEGLPPFIQSYFFISDITAQNLCFGDTTEFNIDVSETITSMNWDFGDGNTSTLESPTHTYAAPGDYTVSVVVETASETKTETSDITISEVPVANPSGPIEGCTSYGSYNLDMPSFDPTFLGAQDPNVFAVSYHLSQTDADNNINSLTGVHVFDYGLTPVYVRIYNRFNTSCYDTTQFDIVARQAPLVDIVSDWTVCDDDLDGLFTFDLSAKNGEIFNGQNTSVFNIIYFASQADADTGLNPLPINYTNTLATEEIFFRFQNSTYPSCYRTGSFMLEVIPGVAANQPANLEVCDDNNDGQANFDLTLTELEIIGTQNAASMVISYHDSQADADTNANPLPTNYTSTSYQKTIYVRVANISDATCYDTTSFQLHIFETPVAPALADWQVCDDNNDGLYSFDLTEKADEIFAVTSGVAVGFYVVQQDAELAQNPIAGPFQNTVNPQTIYFRLENTLNPNCFDVGTFQLAVFDTPTANQPSDIVVCDLDETGSYTFNFGDKDGEVYNGQDEQVYAVSYHATDLDALNYENPLPKNNYQNTDLNEQIFVRIQHTELDFCYDTTSFNLIINPLPELILEDTYVICPDSPDLVVDGGLFETYEWRDVSGAVIGSDEQQPISELGTYTLTVTQTVNGIVCQNTGTFEVLSSGAPESLTVDTSGFSDTVILTINALGIGDFEYSIDGSTYQASNTFEVFPGEYTVYVRDALECRILTEEIIAMGYQKFFSPNGDGTNENWNIIGAELYPDSKVYIYDRYGKLLQQISPQSIGWDGRNQGQLMPSSDYWFRFEYDNGKVFTGHFALKR